MNKYIKDLGKVSLSAEGEWDRNKEYDILSLVNHPITGKTYVSRKQVPTDINLTNIEYWMPFKSGGYLNSGIIIINDIDTSTGLWKRYTLADAINTISIEDRQPGMIVSFYGNANDEDNTGTWYCFQFNSDTVNDWHDLDCWKSLYHNINKNKGLFLTVKELEEFCPNPIEGDFAFVGGSLFTAYTYICTIKDIWVKTSDRIIDNINLNTLADIIVQNTELKEYIINRLNS